MDVRRVKHRSFRAIAAWTAATLVGALAVIAPPVARASTQPAGPLSEQAASEQAQTTDQPVEVTAEASETNQVMANPDGTFTLTARRQPWRVLRDATWMPIDTTLHANADGTLSPSATTEQVAFSGGGSGPLATVTDSDRTLAFSWPAALPAPTVSGSSATYPGVLPGVDLTVTARPDSFNEVLVVHDAAAAANPALSQLHLSVTAAGLDLSADDNGGLTATDATGVEVFHGSAPIMWDSHVDPEVGPTPTAQQVGSGKVSSLAMAMPDADGTDGSAHTTITLTPPGAALTGPDVAYPLYIDPSASKSRYHFAVTFNNGWHYYDDTSEDLKVGDCPQSRLPACNNIGVGRSYFNFDVSAITGKPTTAHVYTADVYVDETHNSAGCTSEPVKLYSAGAISSSTVWGGPALNGLQAVSANFSDSCASSPPANVDFDNSTVVSLFQQWATNDTTIGTFGLIAGNESDIDDWKRFDNNPSISVTYAFAPSVPRDVHTATTNTVACPGKPIYHRDTTPTVYATTTNYSGSADHAGLWFELWNEPATTRLRYNPQAVAASSDVATAWSTNSSNTNSTAPLNDGNYALKAKASSLLHPDQVSGWSAPSYHFSIDHTPPANPPTIRSFAYPPNAWGAPQATPGTFTLNVNNSTGVAGFTYSFDTSGGEALPTNTDCNYNQPSKRWIANNGGAATIPGPSLPPGYHTLYVRSFDDAHNVSAQSSAYVFYIAPTVIDEGPTLREAEDRTVTQPCDDPSQPATPKCQGDPTYNGGIGYPVYAEGPGGIWSNNHQHHLAASAPGAKFTYTFSPALDADYALGIEVTSANHFGILQFELDGRVIEVNGSPVQFDGYSATAGTHYLELGGEHFCGSTKTSTCTKTSHTLTIDVIGQNPSSADGTYNGTYGDITLNNFHDNGYAAGIDYFTWTPINNVKADNFNDAMNNHGIANDNTTAANIGPSRSNAGLSQQTLATAGFGPGATKTIDGVTFTMPTYPAGGNDNVMANGQTIPLPAPTTASTIELLALSTCGDTQSAPGIQLSMNYSDNTEHTDQIPSVPDWANGTPPAAGTPGITLAATLPYRDVGSTPDTSLQPKIYHLTLTNTRPDSIIQSVTLPNLGSSFTDACTTPTLHILAMTTS